MEEELLALLRGASGVTALVNADSMAFGLVPQRTAAPYVVLHVVTALNDLHMNGVTDVTSYRVQIDIYAATLLAAKTIDRAICALLHGYRAGGFDLIIDDTARDMGDEDNGLQGERLHRVSHDFIVHWRD